MQDESRMIRRRNAGSIQKEHRKAREGEDCSRNAGQNGGGVQEKT